MFADHNRIGKLPLIHLEIEDLDYSYSYVPTTAIEIQKSLTLSHLEVFSVFPRF